MSLSAPHPLWTSCSSNPYEVKKAIIQTTLLSGRCKTDYHARHWDKSNPNGFCLLCPGKYLFGTVQHLLLHCEALADTRSKQVEFWSAHASKDVHLHQLLSDLLQASPLLLAQFLLDPSVVPQAIILLQRRIVTLPTLFYLTRTWCFGIHRKRLQLLGRYNYL